MNRIAIALYKCSISITCFCEIPTNVGTLVSCMAFYL